MGVSTLLGGWSDSAMILGKLSVSGCPTNLNIARFPFVDWAVLISGLTFDEYVYFPKRYNAIVL